MTSLRQSELRQSDALEPTIPLEIKNISKKYHQQLAVDGVSFQMNPGEVLGLLGPNGAGKTSIISMITTLEKPTSGEVFVFGKSVQTNPLYTKSHMGVVHQEVISSGFFEVTEILHFQSGIYGKRNNHQRIDYLLHRLDLYEHRHKKVKQLSGGMKRRLMIAKALVHDPQLLLLDEPTAGVDITLRQNLWNFVDELRKEKKSILLTTHYLEEAEHLCDRVAIINKGKLECVGNTQEIVKKFTQREVEIYLNKTLELKSEYLIEQKENYYRFIFPAHFGVGEFLKNFPILLEDIQEMKINDGKLEDAFLRVLRERK